MKYQPCFSGCSNLKPRPSESFTFGDGPLRTLVVRRSVGGGNALVGILSSEKSSKKPAPRSFESFVVCSILGCRLFVRPSDGGTILAELAGELDSLTLLSPNICGRILHQLTVNLKCSKSDNVLFVTFNHFLFKYPQMCSLTGKDLLLATEARFLISGSKTKK